MITLEHSLGDKISKIKSVLNQRIEAGIAAVKAFKTLW